jgi:lysophospholipase L1-like esterase
MNVYVLGDSISIQYGPYLERGLRGIAGYARKTGEAEARLNLDVPAGANGGDSAMVLAFLEAQFAAGGLNADVLLLNCGLHDIKTDPATGRKQVPIEAYEANLRAIVKLVGSAGLCLVWIRTTPADEEVHNRRPDITFHRFAADVASYNAVADRVMAEAGVPEIDLHAFTASLGADLYCDHVHFHESIREKQGTYIAGWIAGWLSGGRRTACSAPSGKPPGTSAT